MINNGLFRMLSLVSGPETFPPSPDVVAEEQPPEENQ